MQAKSSRRGERGMTVLIVSMLLLFATSIVVLYLNRGLLFDLKTSANQARSALALETAEAGIEWVTGMLNDPADIDAACNHLAAATVNTTSLRMQYVLRRFHAAANPSSDVTPATNVLPGCSVTAGGLNCSCPAVPAAPATKAVAALGAAVAPSFTVAFAAVPGDPDAVQVTSYGCTEQAAACSDAGAAGADGYAHVTVTLKRKPTVRAAPTAALTCAGQCQVQGGSIANQDLKSNGLLVNANSTLTLGLAQGVALSTLPGVPVNNALVGNDSSVPLNCGAGFATYFGSTEAAYQNDPATFTCAAGCSGAALTTAYNDGWRQFYIAGSADLTGAFTLGTQADPVTFVVSGQFQAQNGGTVYGLMFFMAQAQWQNTPGIHGAEVACGQYQFQDHNLTYDPIALANTRAHGLMARVPGSWKDFF